MEIKFNNYYSFNKNKIICNNMNFKINDNKIYAFVGNDESNKDKIFENLKRSKNAILNDTRLAIIEKDNTMLESDKKFLNYLYKNIKSKKENQILDIFYLTGITKEITNSSLTSLNNYYLKLLNIIILILNKYNVLVLKEPFYKMNADDENNFIRILKVIKKEYNITFIILTRNTNIIYKFIDYFFVVRNGMIVLEGNRDKLQEINSKYGVEKPDICKFIDVIRKKYDKNFRSFNDVRDLVKEIYRVTR